jgi:membrane associated rhomboid family serine protease
MDIRPVVKNLIIANVVVFLLQNFLTRPAPPQVVDFDAIWPADEESAPACPSGKKHATGSENHPMRERSARRFREAVEEMQRHLPGRRQSIVQEWFELDPKKTVEQGQIWRLVTSAFCHQRAALWNILFNMIVLFWFGQRLERMYGSTEFLLFYLAAAVCAPLAYLALAYHDGTNTPAIGASGAIMGVMMLYVIYHPFEQFLLFWLVPVPLWLLLSVYVLYDLQPILLSLAGDRVFTGVAHAGHLGGLVFGFMYWRFGWRLEPVFDRIRSFPFGRKAMPFRRPVILPFPRRDSLGARVDEILKKISEHGKESLTDEERDILIQASTNYRGGK